MQRRDILKAGALGAAALMIPKVVKSQCDPITADIEGPFYTPNAPTRNVIRPQNAPGTLLFITGTVYYKGCEVPAAGAKIDAWQADSEGAYDNVGYNFRGAFNADDMGNYSMETVLPGKYLNGADFRPRHIHFKINAPDGPILTTQLYFEGDSSIAADPWASQAGAASRTIPLTTDQNDVMHGVFNITLADEAPISSVNSRSSRGEARIVAITPQPLNGDGTATIDVKRAGKISLQIFDLSGRPCATVHSNWLEAGRHVIPVSNQDVHGLRLNAGVYIMQLVHNGTAIDAKRLLLQ